MGYKIWAILKLTDRSQKENEKILKNLASGSRKIQLKKVIEGTTIQSWFNIVHGIICYIYGADDVEVVQSK